jgi:hypothetical protein
MESLASGAVDIPGFLLAVDWTRNTGIAAYALAALAAARAAAGARRPGTGPGRWFWGGVATLFAALTLDVVTNFRFQATGWLRTVVGSLGRLGDKALVQWISVAVLALLAVAAGVVVLRTVTRAGAAARAGSLLAVMTWCAEVVSLHDLSRFLYRGLGPLPLVAWCWVLAGLLVISSAMRAQRRQRDSSSEAALSRA